MRRKTPALLLSLVALSAAMPAAADRAGARQDAEAKLEDAAEQQRRERAAIHDEFDRKARELARRPFASAGDRAEAWRRLEDERRARIAATDSAFEQRLNERRRRLRDG